MKDMQFNFLVRVVPIIACFFLARPAVSAEQAKTPEFDKVSRAIEMYFAAHPDYRSGDLICTSQVQQVLKIVAASGWKMYNAREILERSVPDGSFLAGQLSTPAGRRFMRKISSHAGAYSHLDRLSSVPGGESIVRDLIRKPGGDELVTYMTSTKGGRNMGKMMAGVRGGVDLNKPTGRIYTAADLIAALQESDENNPSKNR